MLVKLCCRTENIILLTNREPGEILSKWGDIIVETNGTVTQSMQLQK